MKSTPQQRTTILLSQAVDLMFEIYLMRGDCSLAARSLVVDGFTEWELEDCARLDDTLAKAYRMLQRTVRDIQCSRGRRNRRARP